MSVGAGRESISVSSHSHSRYPVRTRPAHTYLTVKYLRGFNVWPERERESEAETQNCSIVCGALSPLCALFAFVFVPLFVLRVVKYSSSILVF